MYLENILSKIKTGFILLLLAHLFMGITALSQAKAATSKKKSIIKNTKSRLNKIISKTSQERCLNYPTDDPAYYAPTRYVIVYNEIFKGAVAERRINILMDEKQIDDKNLRCVFELIKKRFPNPIDLYIQVHTNLATIETPEEREMERDSNDKRFSHTYKKYRKARYFRYYDGREVFSYTTQLFPSYEEKSVVLVGRNIQPVEKKRKRLHPKIKFENRFIKTTSYGKNF